MLIRVGADTDDRATAEGEHHGQGRELARNSGAPSPLALVADQQHHIITASRTASISNWTSLHTDKNPLQ
jgi:hypothetical protein